MGFMGTMHAQIYQHLKQARIVAVVDTARKQAAATMENLGIDVPLFDTLEEALGAVEADVVDLCLPTDLHLANSLTAIHAGKHLFCEKPLALTVAEGKKIAAAADRAGVTAQVGQCIRFWPEYVAFKKFLDSGKRGKLLSLALQRRSSLPDHSVDDWIIDPARSGGAAVDLHVHDTDFVLYLLGLPSGVTSEATFDPKLGPSQIFTLFHYSGLCVSAECGWNYPAKWGFQMAFQAVFEDAAVEYDSSADPSLTVTVGKGRKKALPFKKPSIGGSSTGAGNISSLAGYFNELKSFVGALEAKRAPETATLPDAVETLRVVAAGLRSARSGKRVKL